MLAEILHVHIPVYISLLVIITCIVASIIYSVAVTNRASENKETVETDMNREIH